MTTESLPRSGWLRRRSTSARGARPGIRPLVIFVLAVILAFFAVIYSRISLDRSAFELQKLEDAITAEEAQHWDLRVEVARLQDPDRITRIASGMGLVYPTERVTLEVGDIEVEVGDGDYRWSELRALLSERP
jgi:cell division protein FtsL